MVVQERLITNFSTALRDRDQFVIGKDSWAYRKMTGDVENMMGRYGLGVSR